MNTQVSLFERLEREKARLLAHPIYARVRDRADLQVFMARHVVCVWDFMCVLKTLQRDLCGHDSPWVPPKDRLAARLINEITLDEESDVLPDGRVMSHFELYLQGMREVGCSTDGIERLIAQLRDGVDPLAALTSCGMPPENVTFSLMTVAIIQQPLHVRAAAAFYSREDIIPPMFHKLATRLRSEGVPCNDFLTYLDRHITVDQEQHGPAAHRLAHRLIGDGPNKAREAFEGARTALNARIALWDATLEAIERAR